MLQAQLCLSADQVACAIPDICKKVCGNPSGCSDIAYPKLVLELLPIGKVPSTLSSAPREGRGVGMTGRGQNSGVKWLGFIK